MGHKSKFTFPVPGRRNKQPTVHQTTISPPLTKAQRILGTGEINVDSFTLPMGEPHQPWDARSSSGISISISDSSATCTATNDGGLEVPTQELDEEEDGAGMTEATQAWDEESAIIPPQLRTMNGLNMNPTGALRMQRSTMNPGRDYTITDDSSLQRRLSTSSTILTHYDKQKVPLSISQQTSNSAMAKGLPMKASAVLDMDGKLGETTEKKKKPARLDLSLLRSKSRKHRHSQPEQVVPVLRNDFVMKSPSVLLHKGSLDMPLVTPGRRGIQKSIRKVSKKPSGVISPPIHRSKSIRHRNMDDLTELQQLHDHYEESTFRRVPWIPTPQFELEPLTFEELTATEPSPPLTATSPLLTPLISRPIAPTRISDSHQSQDRNSRASFNTNTSSCVLRLPTSQDRNSRASFNTTTSRGSGPRALPSHLTPAKDYASSVSSRHTRTSKASRTERSSIIVDSDLQVSSVLSLSDSESDEDAFSDSGPISSISSHGNPSSRDEVCGPSSRTPQKAVTQPPSSQEFTSNKSRHGSFGSIDDHYTLSTPSGAAPTGRMTSTGTLRSNASSSASTATATGAAGCSMITPGCSSRLSAMSTSTIDSISPPYLGYGVHEATAMPILPLASSDAAALSAPPKTPGALERTRMMHERLRRKSDQPTPPVSPALDSFLGSPKTPNEVVEDHSGTFMEVTKQEQMLLAALRAKRAKMRENILPDHENGRSSAASQNSNHSRVNSRNSENQQVSKIVGTLEANEILATSSNPVLRPVFPSRSSSLLPGLRDFTREHTGMHGRRIIRHSPSSSRDLDMGKRRFELALHNARSIGQLTEYGKAKEPAHQRQESIPLVFDRQTGGVGARAPSPGTSDFMNFSDDSDDEPESVQLSNVHGQTSNRYTLGSKTGPNAFGMRSSQFRMQLSGVPEGADTDGFADFDGVHHGSDHDLNDENTEKYFASSSPREDRRLQLPIRPPHLKNKTSAARLSAVGGSPNSTTPWWGGDD